MADIPMDPHTEAIVALQREVADFRRHVDQRFAAVDQRFAAVDRRFEVLERRLDEQGSGLRALIESVHSDVRLILEHLSPAMTQINRHEQPS